LTVCGSDIPPPSKSGNNWFFHIGIGLDFNSGSPASIVVGGRLTHFSEGRATISDPATGALLFYTAADTIWNRYHVPMGNGSGIKGHWSSAQSELIVPYPGNSDKYYVFTSNGGSGDAIGYYYSIVDLSLRGDSGEVITKDIPLFNGNCPGLPAGVVYGEALTGTVKKEPTCSSNGEYWIAFPSCQGVLHSYLVTDVGISGPVVSIFPSISFINISGYATFSPNGKQMVLGASNMVRAKNTFSIFDFDLNTGVFSNPQTLPTGFGYIGVFSPNNTKLYAPDGSSGRLWQYDMLSTNLQSSRIDFGQSIVQSGIAPDGKIYTTQPGNFIGVINNPDNLGAAANLVLNHISLGGRSCGMMYQNIIPLSVPLKDSLKAHFIYNINSCPDLKVFVSNSSDSIPPPVPCSYYQDDTLNFLWNFGDGNFSNKKNPPTHTYSQPGTYTITLTLSRARTCRNDTTHQTIFLDTIPTIVFSADTVCLGDTTYFYSNVLHAPGSYTLSWSAPLNSAIANPAFTFSSPGNSSIILTLTDSAGCTFADTNIAIVSPLPTINIIADTILCAGDSITLSNTSNANSFQWSPAAGLNNGTIVNPIAKPALTTTYIISLSGICVATDSVTLTIKDLPVVTASPDTSVCLGNSVMFTSEGAVTYTWSPANNLNSTTSSIATATPVLPTSYTVTGISLDGCKDDTTVTVNVNAAPMVNSGADVTILQGQNTTLSATGNGTFYTWNPSTGLSCISSANPLATPEQTTTYYVTTIDGNGCTNTDSVTVFVELLCNIFIPNVFSPNNDGQNDQLKILAGSGIEIALFIIYDRWGEKVFETSNINESWDGLYKNNLMSSGIYVYQLNASCKNDRTEVNRKGNITLIR